MTTTTNHARRGDTSTEGSSLPPRPHVPLSDGADSLPAAPPSRRRTSVARPLGVGLVGLWLSVLVLLPLAALTVTSLVVSSRNALLKANLLDRYDVEFRFGKPDISDDRHAIYLNRRMLVTYNGQDINGIEVR